MNNCGVFARRKQIYRDCVFVVIANGGVAPHPPQAVPLPLIIWEGFVRQSVSFWGITDYFGTTVPRNDILFFRREQPACCSVIPTI